MGGLLAEVCHSSLLVVGWFVNRVTQKLLKGFPQNLDEGWISVQNRPR